MFNKVISNSFLVFFLLFLPFNTVQGDGDPIGWSDGSELPRSLRRYESLRDRYFKDDDVVSTISPQDVDKIALCEILQTSFSGSKPVRVQCGEGPEGIGWISNDARIDRVVVKLRDRETGQERELFHSTLGGPNKGGFYEHFEKNLRGDGIYSSGRMSNKPLPIGLFIPGGCDDSHSSMLEILTRFRREPDDKRFFQEHRECTLFNEKEWIWRSVVPVRGGRDVLYGWRSGVPGIGENEDILHVQYALQPSTPIYYDREGNVRKGILSTFYFQSSYDDIHCESLKDPFVLNYPSRYLKAIVHGEGRAKGSIQSRRCYAFDKEKIPLCLGNSALCSTPNSGEHFEFLKYGCKALPSGSCPPIADCILGEDSFYSSTDYTHLIREMSAEVQRPFNDLYQQRKTKQTSGDR